MSISDVVGIYPVCGLLPDPVECIDCEQDGREPSDAGFFRSLVPPQSLVQSHEPVFLARILRRLRRQIAEPLVERRDAIGRRVLVLLGTWVLVEQRNGCLRPYQWHYETLGRVTLVAVADMLVVAQDMPYQFVWLASLVRPLALEYLNWLGHDPRAQAVISTERYIRWALLEVLAPRIARHSTFKTMRVQIAAHVRLDPWVLGMANRLLRPRGMPQRALLGDYNCVQRHRRAFATLEREGPHLVSLFGVLCRCVGFPKRGEPVQRLKQFLVDRGVSPRTWRVLTRSGPRLWLMVNDYYSGGLPESLLDFIRCIDILGFDRPPPYWLLHRLMAAHGGPGARYPAYSGDISRQQVVWRHVVRLLQGHACPEGSLEEDVERVVTWGAALKMTGLPGTQRRAGWLWLVRQSQDWQTQEQLKLQSRYGRWPVPITEMDWVGYRFRFLDSPLALWQEARAMLHCADTYLVRCANRQCWLVSIAREGRRVATAELRRSGEQWRIHQLAGKANRACAGNVWSAAGAMVALLNGHRIGSLARRSVALLLPMQGVTA